MKDPNWAITVAMAVPAASSLNTATRRISRIILVTAATEIKNKGFFDSPIPRRTPHTAL